MNIIEFVFDPFPIASVILGRIVGHDTIIIGGIAIGESVHQHLVDDFVAPVLHVGFVLNRAFHIIEIETGSSGDGKQREGEGSGVG